MSEKAEFYIKNLKMSEHPEGGYFVETYRSRQIILENSLPSEYDGDRNYSTAIYFLLKSGQISKFHRLKSEEIWHFYDGSPLKLIIINKKGLIDEIILGKSIEDGHTMQTVIHLGTWFGAVVCELNSFSLVGCTMSPGFDYKDFELGDRKLLMSQYPDFSSLIESLT